MLKVIIFLFLLLIFTRNSSHSKELINFYDYLSELQNAQKIIQENYYPQTNLSQSILFQNAIQGLYLVSKDSNYQYSLPKNVKDPLDFRNEFINKFNKILSNNPRLNEKILFRSAYINMFYSVKNIEIPAEEKQQTNSESYYFYNLTNKNIYSYMKINSFDLKIKETFL